MQVMKDGIHPLPKIPKAARTPSGVTVLMFACVCWVCDGVCENLLQLMGQSDCLLTAFAADESVCLCVCIMHGSQSTAIALGN